MAERKRPYQENFFLIVDEDEGKIIQAYGTYPKAKEMRSKIKASWSRKPEKNHTISIYVASEIIKDLERGLLI